MFRCEMSRNYYRRFKVLLGEYSVALNGIGFRLQIQKFELYHMFQVEGVNINISMFVFQHLPVLHEFVASVTRALIDLCAVSRE